MGIHELPAGLWEIGDCRAEGKWGLGMSLWSHVCLTGLRAGTELIAAACRVCRWPISCQSLLLALGSALSPFLSPFYSVLEREMPDTLLTEK